MWNRLKHWALLDKPHSLVEELKPWGPHWRTAIRFWIVLCIMLFLSHSLADIWVFEYAGLWSGDVLAQLRPPQAAAKTAIVSITAEERRKLLGGLSPIPAKRLMQAVCAVLRVKPAVLGVDLSTADVAPDALPKTDTKIVWARGIQISRDPVSGKFSVQQDKVLNQKFPEALSGLAVAPVMPDWSVRQIVGCYEYDRSRVAPTMTAMLARAALAQEDHAGEAACDRPESEEVGAYRIHYKYDRFTLGDFNPEAVDDAGLGRCVRGDGEWAVAATTNHPLRGRVVLLGGEYDAQDWHPTPYGLEPGVEVMASLTEHLLAHSAAWELEHWMVWAVKFVLAILIAFVHCRFRPVAALLVCLVGLGGLVMAGGLLSLYVSAYRATTVPFLLGIVLEQLVTSAERAQEVSSHASGHSGVPVGSSGGGPGHP